MKKEAVVERRSAYRRLRLRKAARKALMDLTPPVIWRAVTGERGKHRSKSPLALDDGGKPFTIGPEGPSHFRYMTANPLVEVPIERMRYAGGLRFTPDEHHFVRYLRDGIQALERFYANHLPRDVMEKHFLPWSARETTPLGGLPWVEYSNGGFDRATAMEKGLGAGHGHQHHGPASPQKIALEAAHLDRLAASFRKHGLKQAGEYPDGHFIVDADGNWAFYVKDGQHRIAVMAALGYESAAARLSGGARVVTERDAANFPMVLRGLVTQAEAISILRAYTRPFAKPGLFD